MTSVAIGAAPWLGRGLLLACGGALLSAALIVALRPLLVRYALARPSARGLHTIPTPQGGGIAVLLACAATAMLGSGLVDLDSEDLVPLMLVLATAGALALVGFIDDVRPLPPLPRLILQLALMAVGVALLPDGTRVFPILPGPIETIILVVAGTWFINLTNFMDGMDGITVADGVPVAAALVLFTMGGHMPLLPGLIALGLLAGLLGYAPFNKPIARLFLGDVGSLPIGFLLAYCLFSLAGQPHGGLGPLLAAVILPLYPIADSGATLLWRLGRGERIWEPHRSHFYQIAVLRGLTVWQVLARVAAANIALAGFAWVCVRFSLASQCMSTIAAVAVTVVTMKALNPRRSRP